MMQGKKRREIIRAQMRSVHLSDQLVDVVLAVSMVASLHIVLEFTCSPSTSWVGEFEWPEEVGGLWRDKYTTITLQIYRSPA
jgi:hypothetical protein